MQSMKKRRFEYFRLFLSLLVFAGIVVLAVTLIGGFGTRVDAEQASRLEDSLRRAAVTCYAVEGRYPATLEYLLENYGVVVDEDAFSVRYEVLAPNLMPIIQVVELAEVVG